MRRRLAALPAVLACVMAVACTGAEEHLPSDPPTSTPTPTVAPARPIALPQVWVPPLASDDQYALAIKQAAARGLQVWVETDLVKSWVQGPEALARTLGRVEELAQLPGVVGVKVADELGYRDGFRYDLGGLRTFLATVHKALHAGVPSTKVLVDLLVPELGCALGVTSVQVPSQLCIGRARIANPTLDLPAVDTILRDHTIDVIDLSSDLQKPAVYAVWGIDAMVAQQAAWEEVHDRGWFSLVAVNARKAITHPGSYKDGAAAAQAAMATYVEIPHAAGVGAVDIWTWHQVSQGVTVQLMDPGLRTNALWAAMATEHRRGVSLLTHFTPTSVMVSVSADLDQIAQVFTGLFVAAGTG